MASHAQAQNRTSLVITDNKQEYLLSPYLIRHHTEQDIQNVNEIIMGFGNSKKIFNMANSIVSLQAPTTYEWISFSANNRSEKNTWLLDFGTSLNGRLGFLNDLEIFRYDRTTGDIQYTGAQGNPNIELSIPSGSQVQFFLKIKKSDVTPFIFSLKLIQKQHYYETFKNNNVVPVFLFAVIALFLGAFAVNNNVSYIGFIIYYISIILFYYLQNSFLFVTPSILNIYIFPFFVNLITVSALWTSVYFLYKEDTILQIKQILTIWSGILFALPLIGYFVPSPWGYTLAYSGSFISIAAIPLISIIQSQYGQRETIPFMLGWLCLAIGFLITVLSVYQVIQPISESVNAYIYCLFPQIVFFFFALKLQKNDVQTSSLVSKTIEINETDSLSKIKESKESLEQKRLLKVIDKERKAMAELRKSEMRRTEEMRQAKESADSASREKSAFLAVVSHEIRTPMTGIMGMVRLLLDSNLTRDQKEYAQTIQESSDAMLSLLNEILDFEKIEQGKMEIEIIDFDLHRLMRGVSHLMNGHAAQKSITLQTKIGDNLPQYVLGDMARLRQVLLNLTGNAIKFTEEGHVTITADLMGMSEDKKNYEIYFGVTDSGIGISEKAQANLFNPFSQADASISRKFGGTGLGLAISRGLIEAMGSTININSKEGEGSTFFFTLKMPKGKAAQAGETKSTTAIENHTAFTTQDDTNTPEENENKPVLDTVLNEEISEIEENKVNIDFPALKILTVDDNSINQRVMEGFLKDKPLTIIPCFSGEKAVEIVESEGDIDIVFMDIELPGMNGDEATKIIRDGDSEYLKNIPIIALTGNIMPDHIEQYKAAGMNSVLEKPIQKDRLEKAILEIVQQRDETQSTTDSSSVDLPKTQAPIETQTLSIEDDTTPSIERPITEKATSFADEVEHNLELEDEDADHAPSLPPIADSDSSSLYSDDDLLIVPDTGNDTPPPTPEEAKNIFNPETLEALKGHISQEDIQSMIDDVIIKSEEIIGELENALKPLSLQVVSEKAHELKGMAGNFGLMKLSNQAGEIELKAKAESTPVIIITGMISELPAALKESKSVIAHWVTSEM